MQPRAYHCHVLNIAIGLCACAGPDEQSTSTFGTITLGGSTSANTTDGTETDATTQASSMGTGDGDGDGDDSGDGDATKLDVLGNDDEGPGTADDGGMDSGCNKIDVILAVDASSSMQAELDSLFETFLEVKTILANDVGEGIEDFHIGVMNACNNPPYLHNWGAGHADCEFPPGQNWLESADPMLDQRFECVVDIPYQDEALEGNGGDNGGYNNSPDYCEDGPDEDEQPALAAAAAIQPGVTQNAGMVRDDAILLVVAITDEDEALADVGSPAQIHDLFMQVKGEGEIVFLGIGGTDCASAYDGGNVADSTELAEVASEFGSHGLFRTMCSGQGSDPIRDAFQEALTTVVDQACDEFVPPG